MRELKAADGYRISNKSYEVNISLDGDVVEYTVVNTKTPEYSIPKTGDNSSPILSVILLALSGIGLIFGVGQLTKRKVKKQ